ncbi:ABC transporter permease subunit [Glaciimonas immobilis]|uniref:ABC-type nitrate/sulfonate/bicarbonate transport system permease component/CRP-like cAMP-binding protein n=1 Tax=Glaciimonas immobilis TaxID=728004 RepID=A0A840RVJ7_9BURK|nr:ABC transporter permease subunit [Glaciimonas immobilis]KAF3996519.1 ABC transporter permease subunit [Glaciimonas immobilis]MBB5201118.1 ABC-type nitrate/sulfonate/bicarbonate transport system permease component/CRP-like cAMP-binding protein [Glaciimonas immobilis]
MEQISTLLRRTMPFQMVTPGLLSAIARFSKWQLFARGDVIYQVGDQPDDIFVISAGKVQHTLPPSDGTSRPLEKTMLSGDVFGWAAVLDNQSGRLAETVCTERTEVLRIDGKKLLDLFAGTPDTGDVVMSRFATMITKEFNASSTVAAKVHHYPHHHPSSGPGAGATAPTMPTGLTLTMFRASQWLKSPKPYLMLLGFTIFLGLWYLTVEVWKLPRFRDMPGLTVVVKEMFSKDPTYGLSLYTPEYYEHIWVSVRRVAIAFVLATVLGVPLGLFLGWSRNFREYIFPLFETLRPIPILAWVPLAILMFSGSETPVIFLTFLASFFATGLNTMLGVESIDESYSRAALCLGASKWQVFKEVVIPGAMPFIFTGLQISVGVAWFSLVAGEMVSGQFGLGYVINTSYTMVRYPTIVIGMITLGAVGYTTSAFVRLIGDYMMQWRVRELALGGR